MNLKLDDSSESCTRIRLSKFGVLIVTSKLIGQHHGVRTPNEAFFQRNPKLGLGRQFGHINFGAFGVFLANLSGPVVLGKHQTFGEDFNQIGDV